MNRVQTYLENCVDDTSDTLTSDETGGNGITVHVEALGVLLSPDVHCESTDTHSRSVDSLRKDESKADTHHVRVVLPYPLPLANPNVVAKQHHERAKDGEDNGEDTGRLGDGERRIRDSHGCGAPRRDGRSGELARLGRWIENAGIRGCEEDEHGRGEEDGDEGADTLGEPLLHRWCTEEEPDAEVTSQIGGLIGADVCECTTEEVETLGTSDVPAFALCGATEDDLRRFGGGRKRSDV